MPAMKFPCKLESGLGRFRAMSEAEEIAQSVRMILLTHRGERPYRPEFGSDLSRYAFENVDTTLRTLIRQDLQYPGDLRAKSAGGRAACQYLLRDPEHRRISSDFRAAEHFVKRAVNYDILPV